MAAKQLYLAQAYFNPRSPRGLRHRDFGAVATIVDAISIHAAQEGCDCSCSEHVLPAKKFQSTQPKRAATHCQLSIAVAYHHFNPRSPRGLRPCVAHCLSTSRQYFNPRSPRGLRLHSQPTPVKRANFNPRSPRGLRQN